MWAINISNIICFKYSLQMGDSSAPLGQSLCPSHTLSRSMHSCSVGHCHWSDGQRNGGVGQFCSSLMSRQSLSPSHFQLVGMHSLLVHWKWLGLQVTGGQELCSSDPSSQSGWPSHSHSSGMQKPSFWHWNSSSWQRPGPRVAGGAAEIEIRLQLLWLTLTSFSNLPAARETFNVSTDSDVQYCML